MQSRKKVCTIAQLRLDAADWLAILRATMISSELVLPLIALLFAGAGAGFAGGLFGIGGGFVVVPALVLLLPLIGASEEQITHLAVGTSLATIIFTSIRSVRSHALRGAVDMELLRSWAPKTQHGSLCPKSRRALESTSIKGALKLGFA